MLENLLKIARDNIKLAIGKENGWWYVQTTDKRKGTYYSITIEEGLQTEMEAFAIANHYAKKYGFEIEYWNHEPNLYAYFHCDKWKMKDSMRLVGIFTKNKLLQKLQEHGLDIELHKNASVQELNDNLQYGYVEVVFLNEDIQKERV